MYPHLPHTSGKRDIPSPFYLPQPQIFSNNSLLLSEEKRIFAARKLNHKNKEANMNNANFSSEALLSNNGDMTSFRYGNSNIRFRTPKRLKRYTEVKEWDNGYIVVMADYEGLGETEEYIDLLPILKNLYINPETFLKPIKSVKIDYHEGRRN
jgi:hypothetical protein